MISERFRLWSPAVRATPLPGECEVVHPCDAEHGVVDTVVFKAAVAENLPGFHPGEDVLDTGPDLLVGTVVLLFPVRKFSLAGRPTVRDDQPGALVAAVGDCGRVADGGLGAGSSQPRESCRLPGSGRPTPQRGG